MWKRLHTQQSCIFKEQFSSDKILSFRLQESLVWNNKESLIAILNTHCLILYCVSQSSFLHQPNWFEGNCLEKLRQFQVTLVKLVDSLENVLSSGCGQCKSKQSVPRSIGHRANFHGKVHDSRSKPLIADQSPKLANCCYSLCTLTIFAANANN